MQPESILGHFVLPALRMMLPVGSGLLHATYKVVTVGGEFVLQKLHTAISDAAVEDMRVVTAYLQK